MKPLKLATAGRGGARAISSSRLAPLLASLPRFETTRVDTPTCVETLSNRT